MFFNDRQFRKIVFLVASTIIMVGATAFGAEQGCVDSLGRVPFPKSFIDKIHEKLPYLFLVPVPRIVKPLDNELVETEKQRWRSLFLNLTDDANQREMSFQFSSIESKIAFLETIESSDSDEVNRILMFSQLRREFDSELVRRLSMRGDGLLSKDDIEDLMDLYYLASNSSGYSISNLKGFLVPGSDLQKAVRMRWQIEFSGTDIYRALSRMNLIRKQDSIWSRARSLSASMAYWVGSVGLNLMSILTIGTPTFIPRWNRLEVWAGEDVDLKKSFYKYEQENRPVVKNEYRVGWVRKILPLIVAGSLTVTSVQAINHLWLQDHNVRQNSIPQMSHLKTRSDLEQILKKEMEKELSIRLGRDLNSEELSSIDQSIAKMRLQEIGRALNERQKI